MILIGHPHKNIAGLIAHRLNSRGDKVFLASDGLSLVEKANEHDLRLFVLDLSICGQNLEIVRTIRAMGSKRHAGIVLFGTDVSPQVRQLAMEVGADMCLSRKDVNSGRLIEIIKDFLPASVAGRRLGSSSAADSGFQLDGPFKWAPRFEAIEGQLTFRAAMVPVVTAMRAAAAKWKAFAARHFRLPALLARRPNVPQLRATNMHVANARRIGADQLSASR